VNGPSLSFTFPFPLSAYKNIAVAEDEKGLQRVRFQYLQELGVSLLTDPSGQIMAIPGTSMPMQTMLPYLCKPQQAALPHLCSSPGRMASCITTR